MEIVKFAQLSIHPSAYVQSENENGFLCVPRSGAVYHQLELSVPEYFTFLSVFESG